jgi:Aerotolerance regulator N-terminal/von Willebrand factor type A domain/CARDB
MSFLNSLPLWSGLAALGVSVPILIHLWSRNQKYQIPWAAMELLKKAMIARSQRIQMEDYVLLALRCLTLILIAAALLRPLFNTAGPAGSGGGNTGVVIGIDASYSMNHGEPARFEKALGKAREILSTLHEGDPVSVVLMSQNPQILFRRTGYETSAFAQGLDKTASVSAFPLNLERNLERLQELVAELKTSKRECYIITDAQVTDWQTLSDQSRNSLRKLCGESRVVVVPVPAAGAENLAITDFNFSAGSLQRDGSARFAAIVRNAGSGAVDTANVEFLADGKLKSRQDVGRLEPGESRPVSFFTSFDEAGEVALTARLSKDDLTDDNERHAVARVRPSIRVLCIDGDLSENTGGEARGAYFAVRALRLKHIEESAPVKVTHVDATDLLAEKPGDYDLVVMINVPDLTEEFGKRLREFTGNGGGLMVFLGDKVAPEQYNTILASGEHPVLPARLVEAATHNDRSEGWQIVAPKGDHPLAGVVASLPTDLTASARFHTAVRAVPLNDGEVILGLGDAKLPLLLGSRDGRVLLFTSSADRSWNSLPVHPLFTILMQQSATMLSSRAELGQDLVGAPIAVPLPGRMAGDEVTVTDPLGAAEPVKVTVVEGSTIGLMTPEKPGVYRVAGGSGQVGAAVAANVDTVESDIRSTDVAALRKWLDDVPVEVVSERLADLALNSRTGRDLSLLLLALGIICFLVQGLFANHLSHRKHADAGDVMTSLQGSRVAASRRS